MIAEYRVSQSAITQAIDGAGAVVHSFAPCTPVDIVEIGFVCDVLTATAGTLRLDYHPTAGDRTTGLVAGTAALGRICTVPDATTPGEHIYKKIGSGASVTGNPGYLELDPGEECSVFAVGEPTAGDGTLYIRYRERAQAGSRIVTNSTEST